MTFQVNSYHLKLLDNIDISWHYDHTNYGAPCVSCDFPYGNDSNIGNICDQMGNAFGWNRFNNIGNEWADEEKEHMLRTHKEMQTVLQILVKTRSIEEGFYKRVDDNWIKLEDNQDDVLPGQLRFSV